jgi:hypothetical protein
MARNQALDGRLLFATHDCALPFNPLYWKPRVITDRSEYNT